MRHQLEDVARDGVEYDVRNGSGLWALSWHPPHSAPDGTRHGATGFCVAQDGAILLISGEGTRWDLPGGRPEAAESWEQTFRREVLEEACAVVGEARLLGFFRGRSLGGPEEGLVLIRSMWRAEVDVLPWEPAFEFTHRKLVPRQELIELSWLDDDAAYPVYRRALVEAGLI